MNHFDTPAAVMRHALSLAKKGLGYVEPNPAVGAVIVDSELKVIAEGYHKSYGGAHAEIEAISQAGALTQDATLFVTLEPCAHTGKTGPCTKAIHRAGIRKVVIGARDPANHDGLSGIEELQSQGIEVEAGLLREQAEQLIAPFSKIRLTGLPYLHAKWAMTLDGKFATRTGHSQWISNEQSRAHVHRLRGRMDGIMIGIQTALADDPLLTARPAGPRTATRVVLDSQARLPQSSQLVQTATTTPLLVAAAQRTVEQQSVNELSKLGAEILLCDSIEQDGHELIVIKSLLEQLASRGMTNLLVEGGSELLGNLFDQDLIDEYHIFISPKIAGGRTAKTPVAGLGREKIPEVSQLLNPETSILDTDIYVHGRLNRTLPNKAE